MLSTELRKNQFVSSAGKIGVINDIFTNKNGTEHRIVLKSADSIVRYATDDENIPFLDWCTHEVNIDAVLLDIEAKKLLATKIKNKAREFMSTRGEDEKLLLYGKTIPCYFVLEDGGDVFARSIYGNKIVMQKRMFTKIEKGYWKKAAEKYLADEEESVSKRLNAFRDEVLKSRIAKLNEFKEKLNEVK